MKKFLILAILWLNIFLVCSQIPPELSFSCGIIDEEELHENFQTLATGCSLINMWSE